jgi:hypothetical protein
MGDDETSATTDREVAEALDVSGAVVAGASILIPAGPQPVWDVLVGVGECSEVVEVGAKFSFKTGPATIKAVIDVLEEPELLRFTGKSAGSATTYAFRLEQRELGTSVLAAQSMGGLAARTMKPVLQGVADKSVVTWLEALAARVSDG